MEIKKIASLGLATLMIAGSTATLPNFFVNSKVRAVDPEDDQEEEYEYEEDEEGNEGFDDDGDYDDADAEDSSNKGKKQKIKLERQKSERKTKIKLGYLNLAKRLGVMEPHNTKFWHARNNKKTGNKIRLRPITNCRLDMLQWRSSFSGHKYYLGAAINQRVQRDEFARNLNEMYGLPKSPYLLSYCIERKSKDGTVRNLGIVTLSCFVKHPESGSKVSFESLGDAWGYGENKEDIQLLQSVPVKEGIEATLTGVFSKLADDSDLQVAVEILSSVMKNMADTKVINLQSIKADLPSGASHEASIITAAGYEKVEDEISVNGTDVTYTYRYSIKRSTRGRVTDPADLHLNSPINNSNDKSKKVLGQNPNAPSSIKTF